MVKKRSHSEMMMLSSCTSTLPSTILSSKRDYHHLYIVLIPLSSQTEFSYYLYKISLADFITRSETSTTRQRKNRHPLPEPILKLPRQKFPRDMGFLAAGSKIYIFGGGHHQPPSWKRSDNDGPPNLSCYAFGTCPNSPNYNVLKETPRLRRGKRKPIVMGPLHGKLYVFSYSLAFFDLEEFNMETECWTPLPHPPLRYRPSQGVKNYSCGDDNINESNDQYGCCIDRYVVQTHSIKDNKLIMFTSGKKIFMYHVVSGCWEVSYGYHEKLSPYLKEPLCFDFMWDGLHSGLYQVYADDQNFGKVVHRRVRGSSVFGRRSVIRAVRHTVVSLGKSSELCIVSYGDPYQPSEYYINVDLCSLASSTENLAVNGGPEVIKHYYATYAVEDEPEEIGYIPACFVISLV